MTTAEAWHATDRLLPLGDTADGAWIAERTARALLTETAWGVRGVSPAHPRFHLAQGAGPRLFPLPPAALPPGELRISLDFAATAGRPLAPLAERLRTALLRTAEGALGLPVAAVDLRVTELLDRPPQRPAPASPPGRTSPPTPADPAALAALAVPGVAALTDVFGAPLQRTPGHLRIEVAVTAGHRAVDVARAVRTALTTGSEESAVAVLVSELR